MRVFLVALALRLIPILLARNLGIGLDDMFQYDMLARSLASGNGFRWYASADLEMLSPYVDFDLSSVDYNPVRGVETSFRAPLYPAFLSLIYVLVANGASRFFAARLAQSLLGAALAPLTYFVALHFISHLPNRDEVGERGDRPAKIAAWAVAAYPILLAYPLGLGTENPFFVLLLSSFYFLLRSIEKPSAFRLLFSGLFLGLTVLTRSVILPFAVLAIVFTFYVLRKRAWLIVLAFALAVSPWVVRNSLLHHKLTGIETSMGYNLYLGYHPQGNGSFVFGPSLDLLTILDDAERDRVGTEKAIEFIRAEPERFISLAAQRLGFFFGLEKRVLMYFYGNNIVGFIPFPLLLALFLVMLLPFIIIGLSAALGASLLKWNPPTILLALLFFAYITPHVLILSEDRFHLALVPFLAILASNFWTGGWKSLAARWNESRAGKIAVALGILVAFLFLLNWGLELARDADKIIQLFGPNGNQSYFPY
ncbi:MAG: glycosyltransferase family 39 protein [Chloroflexi bacterium]|nr:glycosyltransferase family 39 protein [Chloroflexota bacterium]